MQKIVHSIYIAEKPKCVQLVLQNNNSTQLEEVLDFCATLGLPITLEKLGITENIEEKIMAVAKASCAENETIHNLPFKVTPECVYAAILATDRLGQVWSE